MTSLREALPPTNFTVDEVEAKGFPRNEIIALLHVLEADNRGKFTVGRRGKPSRFEWTVPPKQEPKPAPPPVVQPVVRRVAVGELEIPANPTLFASHEKPAPVPAAWLKDCSFWAYEQRQAIAQELLAYRKLAGMPLDNPEPATTLLEDQCTASPSSESEP